MQLIATKLSAVRPAAEGWTDNELRSLIHGCGGSPRRAKRALRSELEVEGLSLAGFLQSQFDADIAAGTHFIHATRNANQRWAALFPSTEAPEGGEGEDDADPEGAEVVAELPAAEPAPKRRRVKAKPLAEAADQPALL
jgi:hypothetical protein